MPSLLANRVEDTRDILGKALQAKVVELPLSYFKRLTTNRYCTVATVVAFQVENRGSFKP
jgi:hypothetical protein